MLTGLGTSVEEWPKSEYINVENFDVFQTELEEHLISLLSIQTPWLQLFSTTARPPCRNLKRHYV